MRNAPGVNEANFRNEVQILGVKGSSAVTTPSGSYFTTRHRRKVASVKRSAISLSIKSPGAIWISSVFCDDGDEVIESLSTHPSVLVFACRGGPCFARIISSAALTSRNFPARRCFLTFSSEEADISFGSSSNHTSEMMAMDAIK